jgi:hypothetical protein
MPHRALIVVQFALLAGLLAGTGLVRAAEPAATVILAVGPVNDRAAAGRQRPLHDGDRVYSGDRLSTGHGAWLDMDFDDGGRMLLRPDTRFQIEHFDYLPAAHPANAPPTTAAEHESAFFRLLKGGLRAISGLIGHVYRDSYRLDTPVATIGIRGTQYDVRYCTNDCGNETADSTVPVNGLYAGVDKGAIAIRNQVGETITTAGQYLFVRGTHSPIALLPSPPAALRHMRLPSEYRRQDAVNRKRFENRQRMEQRLKERRRLRMRLHNRRLRTHGGG